jgi:DNA polymerase IV
LKIPHIVHIDLTAFFVSVERAINPDYAGKPIMVAGSPEHRGVVTCASYEVRKYGVHAGMATVTALKKCPIAIRVQSHYDAYVEYSEKIHNFLEPFAPVMEAASIDEFYLDWTGCERLLDNDLPGGARRIQQTLDEQFHLPCAMGLASNKVTAKVACDQAKPDGIIQVPFGGEALFLKKLPVKVLPGVGEVMLHNLSKYGIKTCGDIAVMDTDTVNQLFGKWGLYVQECAQGNGPTTLTIEHERKSISTEETFPKDITDKTYLRNELHRMVTEITRELRALNLQAQCVQIKLRYFDWVDQTRQITVLPTHDPVVVYNHALTLLEKADTRKLPVRLLGVGVSKFTRESDVLDLLKDNQDKRSGLLTAVDHINMKFEKPMIKIGLGKFD